MDSDCKNNPVQQCEYTNRINALEQQYDKFSERVRSAHKEIYGRLTALEQSDAVHNTQFNTINSKLDKLIAWQDEQIKKPSTFLDSIKSNIAWALIAAVIGYVIGSLGLT